jgi:transposase-like protein
MPWRDEHLEISFTDEELREIDAIAKKHGTGTAEILKRAIKVMRKSGGPSTGELARDETRVIQLIQQLPRMERDALEENLQSIPAGPQIWTPVDEAVRNRSQVIAYSRLIISALDPAISYDSRRQHNEPVPELWSEDREYISELRKLVSELRRLNELLASSSAQQVETLEAITGLTKHAKIFFQNYTSAFGKAAGKGSWYLLVGSVAALLYQVGAGHEIVKEILTNGKAIK